MQGKREAAMNPWKKYLKGIVVGLVLAGVLLAVCGGLVVAGLLPESRMDGSVLICCFIGTLLGAIFSECKHLVGGICVGGGVSVVLCVSGILLYRETDILWGIAVVTACTLGGAPMGVLDKSRIHKRRR